MTSRINEDLKRLTKWVKDPAGDGLKSYTERIMIALAADNQTRAPGSLRGAENWIGAAWAELDGEQQEVVRQYQRLRDADRSVDPDQQAERLVSDIREKLGEIWFLDLPEEDRRRHMETVKAVIDVHYLSDLGADT